MDYTPEEVLVLASIFVGAGGTEINSGAVVDVCSGVDGDAFSTGYNMISDAGPGTIHVNDNQWHHAVMVRSGGTLKMYVDNVLDSAQTVAFTANLSNAANLQIGKNVCGSWFDGSLDDVRLYGKALSLPEIKQLYLLGK